MTEAPTFDPDLPLQVRAAGTVWERCPGCAQPNHDDGRPSWRSEPDAKGGRAHADSGSIRSWMDSTRRDDVLTDLARTREIPEWLIGAVCLALGLALAAVGLALWAVTS